MASAPPNIPGGIPLGGPQRVAAVHDAALAAMYGDGVMFLAAVTIYAGRVERDDDGNEIRPTFDEAVAMAVEAGGEFRKIINEMDLERTNEA